MTSSYLTFSRIHTAKHDRVIQMWNLQSHEKGRDGSMAFQSLMANYIRGCWFVSLNLTLVTITQSSDNPQSSLEGFTYPHWAFVASSRVQIPTDGSCFTRRLTVHTVNRRTHCVVLVCSSSSQKCVWLSHCTLVRDWVQPCRLCCFLLLFLYTFSTMLLKCFFSSL